MKLVVCWSYCSCEGTWDYVECIDYDSKESFQIDFIDMIETVTEARKEQDKLRRKLSDALASKDQKKITEMAKKLSDLKIPEKKIGHIVFDGYDVEDQGDYPEVYELDEWFEKKTNVWSGK